MRFLKWFGRPVPRLATSILLLSLSVFTSFELSQRPPVIDTLPGRSSAIMSPEASGQSIGLPGVVSHDTDWTVGGSDWINPRAPRYWDFAPQLLAAHSPKLTNATANAAADAVAALFNSCYLKILDGTQAATADTAIGAQVTLATLRCNSTAFASASSGVATANAITSDTDAAATGTASWFRILKSDNSTVVMDGSVGTSGADINLTTVSIVQHATVAISSFSYTQSKS